MHVQASALAYETSPPFAEARTPAPERGAVREAAEAAARRVAPLWPLTRFVAVNPFLGLSDRSFARAVEELRRLAGARVTMPRGFYAQAIAEGRITDADLAAALAEAPAVGDIPRDVAALKAAAAAGEPPRAEPLATVADVVAAIDDRDWPDFVTQRVSTWAGRYFDAGQAAWRAPWRELPPYRAWRAEAALDRTPEVMGLAGFRARVAALPEDAESVLDAAVARLGLAPGALEVYFHRLLMTVQGWAGYARFRVWERELAGGADATLTELLAIRVAWELALFETFAEAPALAEAWSTARDAYRTLASEAAHAPDAAVVVDTLLQAAYERAWQRDLLAELARPAAAHSGPAQPDVQAVFCIDVRSEVLRRALEGVASEVETLGFAGFFGFPISYVEFAREQGTPRCPALLAPAAEIREGLADGGPAAEAEAARGQVLKRRASQAWLSFKAAAVACFAFVESVGLAYLPKLVTDSLGLTRPVPAPGSPDEHAGRRVRPKLAAGTVDGHRTGLTLQEKIAMAEGALNGMGLREGFARLVLLVGHGSTTVNNPHATGLDCGACGGLSGEGNARVAAAVLNDPEVRAGLAGRGIAVPEDTVFLGCRHDTTTDTITICDPEDVPVSHADDLARIEAALAEAGRRTRQERAARLFPEPGRAPEKAIRARARDWSQVRPEWGLAGCAAFIAAPRRRTQGLDLGGRAFLHSYDWRTDDNFAVLELIMTAPMVVASWISLQYYGSTVDNAVFGSGNKVLHNVVGTLGVLEGNGGDLRVGLPWQSVHDGESLAHEPRRLTVLIEAPIEAIDKVIAKHQTVRELVDNGWLYLFALTDDGPRAWRYRGAGQWMAAAPGEPASAC